MLRHFVAKGGWVALVCFAVAGGFGGFAQSARSQAAALESRGVVAVATVESLWTERHRRRSSGGTYRTETDHLARYAFRAPPAANMPLESYEITRAIPEFVWDELRSGEEVEVRYLPGDPEGAEVFAGATRRDMWFLLLMAGVFAITGACLAPLPWRAARRARRIEEAGIEAEGVLERARMWNGRWRVWVRFQDAEGVAREGDAFVEKGSAWFKSRIGDAVRLRYDPADPSNVAPA